MRIRLKELRRTRKRAEERHKDRLREQAKMSASPKRK